MTSGTVRAHDWTNRVPFCTLGVVLAAVVLLGSSVGAEAATGAPDLLSETRVSSPGDSESVPGEGASDPAVATHPTDPLRIAVAYLRFTVSGPCGVDPALVISHDGGLTWKETQKRPWTGSGRCPGYHAAIAWGSGPGGSARLYWTDMVSDGGGLRLGITWSDDEGATWSRLYVESRTPPWVGGLPDITVDRSSGSPNRGVVYIVYNWLADSRHGPGLRLLASPDFGRTWRPLEIGRAAAPAGYPASWRIDYQVRTAPDGAAYVAFFQEDLRTWDAGRIFWKGGPGNVGRVGFAVTRVTFDRTSGRLVATPAAMIARLPVNAWTAYSAATPGTGDNLVDPTWSLGLDVDPVTGRVFLAIGNYRTSRAATMPRGIIRVGRSDDGGETWRWTQLAPLPPVGGRPQSSFRPVISVSGADLVVVGLRGITDVPVGTSPGLRLPTLTEAYAVSLDDGITFDTPRSTSSIRWSAAALATATNGPGLRDGIDRAADGRVVYVYGDGRLARPAPDRRAGRVAIFAAILGT